VLVTDLPGTREISEHFPYVRLMSLAEQDSLWANTAVEMISQGKPDRTVAARCLSESPFELSSSIERYQQIWREASATSC
jgi:hypothetical protein